MIKGNVIYLTEYGEKEYKWGKVIAFALIIFVGLMLRDSYGVNINKYLLLLVCLIPIFTFDTVRLCAFLSFIFPLYVGLPGNYISVFILLRFAFEALHKGIKVDVYVFVLTFFLSMYIFCQNLFFDYMSIYTLMGAMDFVVLLFFATIMFRDNSVKLVFLFYAAGIFSMAFIMLMTTLNYYSITELLVSSSRLGTTGMLSGETVSAMVVSIDPNFLGMDVIAVLSTGCLLFYKIKAVAQKMLLTIMLVVTSAICLLGLSRAFLIILIVWIALYFLLQGNLKYSLVFVGAIVILYVIFVTAFPDVYAAFANRFASSDMVGGNGRIELILIYMEQWKETILSMLFGIGLYNCHTHSAPLMYLFGLGIIGFVILLAWIFRLISISKAGCRVKLKYWIPLLATIGMAATIPAAGAMQYVYPMFIAILALRIGAADENIE